MTSSLRSTNSSSLSISCGAPIVASVEPYPVQRRETFGPRMNLIFKAGFQSHNGDEKKYAHTFGSELPKGPVHIVKTCFTFGQTRGAHPSMEEGGPISSNSAARSGSS